MLKKKSYYIAAVVLGALLMAAAILLNLVWDIPKAMQGVLLGVGSGLFGMGVANWVMKSMEEKDPAVAKQNAVEYQDERNTVIRNRAKAHAGDIMQWGLVALAYITILADASLWITLAIVAVYALKFLLELYYMGKYQKEM